MWLLGRNGRFRGTYRLYLLVLDCDCVVTKVSVGPVASSYKTTRSHDPQFHNRETLRSYKVNCDFLFKYKVVGNMLAAWIVSQDFSFLMMQVWRNIQGKDYPNRKCRRSHASLRKSLFSIFHLSIPFLFHFFLFHVFDYERFVSADVCVMLSSELYKL